VKPTPSLGLAAGCNASSIPDPREDINAPEFSVRIFPGPRFRNFFGYAKLLNGMVPVMISL
jgi:hypothetical protein